jgi:hypothetical protein
MLADKFHAGNEDGGEIGAFGGLQEVRRYKELVMGGKVDASFVEEGVFRGLG